jgi:LmbE family N-acetylglucosaminyl deacetylase
MRLAGKDPTAIGRNQDINLIDISRWVTPVTTTIDVTDALAEKQRASEAHASQYSGGPGWLAVIPAPIRRRVAGREQFTCVFPGGDHDEHDLFAGIV